MTLAEEPFKVAPDDNLPNPKFSFVRRSYRTQWRGELNKGTRCQRKPGTMDEQWRAIYKDLLREETHEGDADGNRKKKRTTKEIPLTQLEKMGRVRQRKKQEEEQGHCLRCKTAVPETQEHLLKCEKNKDIWTRWREKL